MLNNIGLPGLILIFLVIAAIIAIIVATTKSSSGSTGNRSVQYAGFWIRALAMLIDSVVVTVLVFVPAFAIYFLLEGLPLAELVVLVLQILIPWFYYAKMESGPAQATLGKMVLGIKVTDMEGNPISFGRATGRFFGKFLSHIILLFGYFMAGWTARKQALHDKMADTLVVKGSAQVGAPASASSV